MPMSPVVYNETREFARNLTSKGEGEKVIALAEGWERDALDYKRLSDFLAAGFANANPKGRPFRIGAIDWCREYAAALYQGMADAEAEAKRATVTSFSMPSGSVALGMLMSSLTPRI